MGKNKKKKYLIGVDLGGTKMLAGLLDRDYKVKASEKTKVYVSEGPKTFINSLNESISHLLEEYSLSPRQIAAIGIGCPGIIDSQKGVVISSPNIPFLHHLELVKKIKKTFGIPAVLGNDVNVGLFGEQRLGAARGYKHVVGIFLGTGVGGALIFNDSIYEGASGGAGEIGHMTVDPMGLLCGCGKRGCLETLAGRLGIASEAAMLAMRQQAPRLYAAVGGDMSKIKSGVLAKAVKSGDKVLAGMIEERARHLGIAMGNVVNLLNPQMIVLGGGVMEAMGNLILPASEEAMRKTAMEPLGRKVKVVAAKLGDYAIVKGAAVMASEFAEREG